MEKRNVTLSLPRSLIRKAKILAASRDKSLSDLFREAIEEKVNEETDYRRAKSRQQKLMNHGFDLGTKGRITPTREELHERR